MAKAQLKAIEDYVRLLDRNAFTHAIRTAVHLGVFDALEKRQHTVEELSRDLGLNADALILLLRVLCRTELVQNFGDDFALSTVGRMIPGAFRDFGDHHWQYLAGFIKTGTPLPGHEDVPVTEADFQGNWASSEWTPTPAALDMADILEAGKSRKGMRILEIGCGAAVFGSALAHRDVECQLFLLDSRVEIGRATKSVNGIGIEGRTQFIEADYMDDGLESLIGEAAGTSGFDLVLLAGVLHRHPLEECKRLLERVSSLARPAGEIAIVDIFPGQEKGDAHRSVLELELALRTRHCAVHGPDPLRGILNEVGMANVKYSHLPSPPFIWGLIVASRASQA